MLSKEIETVRAALGDLAGKVGPDEWAVVSSCRRVLEAVQESAEALETRLVPGTASKPTVAQAQ